MSPPPPLKRIDTAEFRRQLVGLSDPSRKMDVMSEVSIRNEVIDFVAMLPELYGHDDRLKLWEYVAKAVYLACQEIRSDDVQAWSCVVLRELRTEQWAAATNERWCQFQQLLMVRPSEWREAFIRQANRCLPAILPLARDKWQKSHAKPPMAATVASVPKTEEPNGQPELFGGEA